MWKRVSDHRKINNFSDWLFQLFAECTCQHSEAKIKSEQSCLFINKENMKYNSEAMNIDYNVQMYSYIVKLFCTVEST